MNFSESFARVADHAQDVPIQVQFVKRSGGRHEEDLLGRRGDTEPARSDLSPFLEKLSIGIENLDPPIPRIGDVHIPLCVGGNEVRQAELTWSRPFLPPFLYKVSILVIFHAPRVAVPVTAVDLAVKAKGNICWPVKSQVEVRPRIRTLRARLTRGWGRAGLRVNC